MRRGPVIQWAMNIIIIMSGGTARPGRAYANLTRSFGTGSSSRKSLSWVSEVTRAVLVDCDPNPKSSTVCGPGL